SARVDGRGLESNEGKVGQRCPTNAGRVEDHAAYPTKISFSVIFNSTPAAFAASCNAAASITTGSLLTCNRRIRPSPLRVPTVSVIFNPLRLQPTRVPSGSFAFIGLMNASV